MRPLRRVTGRVAVLDRPDVDTDQIIPKQFLKRIERTGFGEFLFYDWRFDEDGNERPGFELDRPEFRGASILLAGRNFGCGSSREHAAWALQDYGFDAVIAPSFGDIFRINSGKIGMLVIALPAVEVDGLMESIDLDTGSEMTVDLERRVVVAPDGREVPFEFDETLRHRILHGLDEIALTLEHKDAIAAYETAHGFSGTSRRSREVPGKATRDGRGAARRRDRAGGRRGGGPRAGRARDRSHGARLRRERDPRTGDAAPRRDARRLSRVRRGPPRRGRAAGARRAPGAARSRGSWGCARSSASMRTCDRRARRESTS
ncbi:MAG: 3-isopropylmalate dehydratase small subunit [Gaiella sp.]|nr:3-isopropylmalate dehydratase small subunit [Gaiella sp.]